ncbi:ABC transporter ATP-binding protein [bacterium]|nr:ABC transporter ATP-binding protein [bacterium]
MLLDVKNLKTHFPTQTGLVRAVNGIDLQVREGAAVGIVGESGSGKSVLSMTMMGLVPSPPAIISADQVQFEGKDLLKATASEMRQIRGNRLAMIFQDPMTSLNPFLTIGDQLSEPLLIHKNLTSSQAKKRVIELLASVGIPDPVARYRSYPHEFSGGMRQRAMVAMAVACGPALLIADEPTTALDVTIQAQILELMQSIRQNEGTAVILITHDMGVAAGFCDEIYVMYAGRVVERGPTERLFAEPTHPYTKALLSSVPRLDDPPGGRFRTIPGQPPDLTNLPVGCAFSPRCPYVIDTCRKEVPPLTTVPGESVAREKACFVEIRGKEAGQ